MTVCSDGDQVYGVDQGMWEACDSTDKRYATTDFDGILQISPNGTLKCYIIRGTNG